MNPDMTRPAIPAQRPPMPSPPEPAARLRGTVPDLISRAMASGEPRLVRAAEKVEDLLRDLAQQVAEYERGAELRAEAERLEQRLAEIKGQLGQRRPAAAGAERGRTKEENRAVRQWAANNGVACPQRGRIPAAVYAAYEEARS